MYWYLEVMSKYAVFSGRARRKEYWMFQLVNFVVVLVLVAAFLTKPSRSLVPVLMLATIGYALTTLIPGLAVSVRRLHDVNFSGWWLLVGFVPMGGLVLLVFHVLDSTPGPNQYGPNPKGIGNPYASPYGSRTMAAAAGVGSFPRSQRMVAFCTTCGAPMPLSAASCPKCGSPSR
jgi:uncharacterized membrane protein YhaH (DUF805 family)